jgi:hypothetical protein
MGILVGDGDYFWIYWPKDKPRYGWETGKYAEEYGGKAGIVNKRVVKGSVLTFSA